MFKSLKGQLLLDGGKLRGSFFSRTVVLVCDHDSEGAFGLVLNRPTENKVGDALVADLPQTLKSQTLYLGGPVQPQALTYIHSAIAMSPGNIMDQLSFGHSLDELAELVETSLPGRHLRVFAGYAGWSAGQLDDEMGRRAWLTHPASVDLVFDHDPARLWKSILHLKGWRFRLLADAPEDLSMN